MLRKYVSKLIEELSAHNVPNMFFTPLGVENHHLQSSIKDPSPRPGSQEKHVPWDLSRTCLGHAWEAWGTCLGCLWKYCREAFKQLLEHYLKSTKQYKLVRIIQPHERI